MSAEIFMAGYSLFDMCVWKPDYQTEPTNTIMHLEDKHLVAQTWLFGDQSVGPRLNETIFENVQEYIRQTRRFCVLEQLLHLD